MARKLKEIDIVEPNVVNKKRKIKKEPVEVTFVTSKEVEEKMKEVDTVLASKEYQELVKKAPTEKQIAAREKAKLVREEKKAKELEEIKQQAIEEALKAKEIADKKAAKAAERKAKKETKTETVIQEPVVATPLEEFKDEPKPDKPTFTPKKEVISEPVVLNLKPPAIFSERPSDFNRGKKKGTPFGAGSIVRRIM